MRTTVSLRELIRTAPPPGHIARSNVLDVQRAAQSTQANDGASKSEVDLRGLTIEPALTHLDRFMDRALLAGVPLLTVLHGKGSGALRNAIRQHLRTHYPQVVALADGPDPGPGNGVTVVTL
jgi:DNA mismatch repair protein MutS2